MKYLLDTHAWIWWNQSEERLTQRVKDIISGQNELYLSDISAWEFCKLVEKGKIEISVDTHFWVNEALKMKSLKTIRMTPEITCQSTLLPQPFHNDPADQIIVATARVIGATLLSKDERIINYKHVKTIWT